jgi:hypothetical protein
MSERRVEERIDHEEAKRDAEFWAERGTGPIRRVSRAYLALLSERDALQHNFGEMRELLRFKQRCLDKALARLPATEPAQHILSDEYKAERFRERHPGGGIVGDEPAQPEEQPYCADYCGCLDWTVKQHGRITHKHSCPVRRDPWCQTHPKDCPLPTEEETREGWIGSDVAPSDGLYRDR